MSSQLRKYWRQILLSSKTNHCLQYQQPITLPCQSELCRKNVSERKYSSFCAFPDSRIDENEDSDEFDGGYMYDFPADIPDHTQPLIRKLMQEIETHSLFYFYPTPKHLSSKDWMNLLECDTSVKRRKLCSYLFWKEKRREVQRKRAKDRKEPFGNRETDHEPVRTIFSTSDVVPYKPALNSLFNAIHTLKFMERTQDLRVMKSVIHGPHVIIDCSYESFMRESELTSCVRQMTMTRNSNRTFNRPFNIIHCNMDVNGIIMKKLLNFLPNCMDPANTFHYTEKNFLDLFPREKLVYLSPHSDVELKTYDSDSVYIVGALVDHTPKIGLSSEKAHLSGIRTAKFPLEKYTNWCKGTKTHHVKAVQTTISSSRASKCVVQRLQNFDRCLAVCILNDLNEGFSWDEILLKRIQPQRTTYSGVYWQDQASLEPLSTKFIDHSYFLEHNKERKIKQN